MASDQFIKIDGVEGESDDAQHKNEIEIDSWGAGVTLTKQTAKHLSRQKVMHDISIKLKTNKATPILLQACASGRKFPSAVITMRKAGGAQEEYVIVKLSQVVITSVRMSSDAARPSADEMVLNFTKIEWEYKPQENRGLVGMPIKVGYDVTTDKIA